MPPNANNYTTLNNTWDKASNLSLSGYDFFRDLGKWTKVEGYQTGQILNCPYNTYPLLNFETKQFECKKDMVENYYNKLGNTYTQAANINPYNSLSNLSYY
jgi:hypothetical protein